MNDTVVCFVGILDKKIHEKIVAELRMHNIQTTDDIKHATHIVHIPDEAHQMTIQELAEELVELTQAEISELSYTLNKHYNISDLPVVEESRPLPAHYTPKHMHKKFSSNHALKQYNYTKQSLNRIIFHRTKYK